MADGGLDTELDAEVAAAVRARRSRVLAEAGMRVRRAAMPPLRPAQRAAPAGDAGRDARPCTASGSRPATADYNPQTVARMEPGFDVSGVDYAARAVRPRRRCCARFCAEVFADADVLALPTCPVATPGIAETDTGGDARFMAIANRLGTLVGPFNYLGLPALSLPMGLDAQRHAAGPAAGRPAVRRGAAAAGGPRLRGRRRTACAPPPLGRA